MQNWQPPTTQLQARDRQILFEKMPDLVPRMVWLCDSHGERFFFSPNWLRFTGVDQSSAEADGWLSLVHPNDRQRVSKFMKSAIATQQPLAIADLDKDHNSPNAIWKLGSDFTTVKANPAVYQQIGTTDDSVGQRIDDASILKNKNISDVVEALVHDLKSPLIGAERTFEALFRGAAGELDPDLEKILQVLNRGNRSMLEMIQNLLELQRSDTGDAQLILERDDVFDIVRATLQELSALADDRGITLIDEMPIEPAILNVERTSIKRVFHNLISNSLKFTNRGGMIRLSSHSSATKLAITVTDSGIGIRDQDKEHLFERYFQGQLNRRQYDGTGLGLYLCKNIIERHGGHIFVQSKEGQGSAFTVELPVL